MHPNCISNVAQDQGSQRWYPVTKERVLLTDDLGSDLKDGGSTLVQRFDQPVGGMQPLGQVIFLGLATRGLANSSVVAVVDQNAGEGFSIELDDLISPIISATSAASTRHTRIRAATLRVASNGR